MPFITFLMPDKDKQYTFDDFLNGRVLLETFQKYQTTKTFLKENISPEVLEKFQIDKMIDSLEAFNKKYENLINVKNKEELYTSFKIPKRSGGLRKIDAPKESLMEALRSLKDLLESFGALSHNQSFAYVKGRCAVDAVRFHQKNQSRWFLKLDFSNFFGNTTDKFILSQFEKIFPFSEILKTEKGKKEFKTALSLCFLNKGLPQGTPISPVLTNIMMVPIDYDINKFCSEQSPHLCYTRYADDILISCRYSFQWSHTIKKVEEILQKYNSPFSFNHQKTRYASSSGRNWNLGVMLNKDNQITVGHAKKKMLKVKIFSFLRDYTNGNIWDISDVQELNGIISYYKSVEGDEIIDKIISKYEKDFNLKLKELFKQIMNS